MFCSYTGLTYMQARFVVILSEVIHQSTRAYQIATMIPRLGLGTKGWVINVGLVSNV